MRLRLPHRSSTPGTDEQADEDDQRQADDRQVDDLLGPERTRHDRVAPRPGDRETDRRPATERQGEPATIVGAESADRPGHRHDDQHEGDGNGLGRLRRMGGDRGPEAAPWPGAEVAGRPVETRRQSLTSPAQDVGCLAERQDGQHGQGADLVPAPDRHVEQPGDEPAAERSQDDRAAERQATRSGVEDRRSVAGVVVEVKRDVGDPPAEDRSGNDPQGHEQDIVAAQLAAGRVVVPARP